MAAFQSGFQLGTNAFGQGQKMALAQEELAMQKDRDARAAELHKQAIAEGGLRLGALQRVDTATQDLDRAARVGMRIPEAIKANDADFDAAVEATGRGLPMPQSGPMRPEWRAATPVDLNQAQMGLAAAKGDVAGMEATRMGRRTIDKDEIAAGVMKMPLADIEKLAPQVSKSGYPMLYTGKDKNGYTFLKTEADGVTPISGSQFTLNESQLRQFALAHKLGEEGFGTDAMALLGATHKDVGDHVSKWNSAIGATATNNNAATHNAASDRNGAVSAGAAASRAAGANRLSDAQVGVIKEGAANRLEAAEIAGEYEALTPAEQAGPKGQGLIRRFNMTNAKAGGQVSLGGAGKAPKDDKPVEVKEEGGKVTIGGKLMFHDGNGGYMSAGDNGKPKGVFPSQRPAALKAAGVPDNAIPQLKWNTDGTAVSLNGLRFDLNELKQIPGEVARINRNTLFAEEDSKRSMGLHGNMREQRAMRENPPAEPSNSGFGPKITNRPDPYAPSIYAGPEEWEAYRKFQNAPR